MSTRLGTRRSVAGVAIVCALLIGAAAVFGQGRGSRRGAPRPESFPTWTNAPGFEKDVFTFVRIQYSSHGGGYGWRRGGGWATDHPDAEQNLAYRLQQMTSMKVNPKGEVLTISDPELFRYPFIYIVEPGRLVFEDEEVPILRRYLLNGGFLMIDDFWGDDEWENLETEIKRVFPDREIFDIPRTDPLFHCVFPIPPDLNLQLPSIGYGWERDPDGVTWETNKRYDTDTNAHIRGIRDDKGRLCVIICHNTDNGDGWEQEGMNEFYFREFSEKKAYPLGINIIFYAMTH